MNLTENNEIHVKENLKHLNWSPRRRERRCGLKKNKKALFEEIMTKNFPK